MKIKFDSTQQYQQDAVAAFVDLFEGQPLNQGDYTVTINESQANSDIFAVELGAIGKNIIVHSDAMPLS